MVFIEESDGDQIRLAPGPTAEICHVLADEVIRRGSPLVAIAPIKAAIAKMELPSNRRGDGANTFRTLSSVHADLCKLCLASKSVVLMLPR